MYKGTKYKNNNKDPMLQQIGQLQYDGIPGGTIYSLRDILI